MAFSTRASLLRCLAQNRLQLHDHQPAASGLGYALLHWRESVTPMRKQGQTRVQDRAQARALAQDRFDFTRPSGNDAPGGSAHLPRCAQLLPESYGYSESSDKGDGDGHGRARGGGDGDGGSSEVVGGVLLDPFTGSGTTIAEALRGVLIHRHHGLGRGRSRRTHRRRRDRTPLRARRSRRQ